MPDKILRGRVLRFLSEPQGIDDRASYAYDEDGAILIRDGLVAASGAAADIIAQAPDAPVTDHRPHLLMPGFIDAHIHMPQAQVIASWGAQLLDWLNTYTFPAESKFSDPAHAARIAGAFLDELLRHGTTTAVAYCSSHPASVDAYFEAAEARGLRMIGGKVMMDRNCPDGVRDTAQSSYDDSKALIAKWHGKGRALYAITPRFAITSTPEQMAMAQALVVEHPDLHMQTHLSENRDEIDFTLSLYPKARDYLDVYETYGLLGPKSLFGHAIHLSDRETAAMAATGSVAVFCPTSNLFLGSGLYDKIGLRETGRPPRGRDRRRRRHQLLDAPHPRRGLQGPRPSRPEARPAHRLLVGHPRQRRGSRPRGHHRHARAGHRGRHRRAGRPRHAGDGAPCRDHRDAGRGALPARDPRGRPGDRRDLRRRRALAARRRVIGIAVPARAVSGVPRR